MKFNVMRHCHRVAVAMTFMGMLGTAFAVPLPIPRPSDRMTAPVMPEPRPSGQAATPKPVPTPIPRPAPAVLPQLSEQSSPAEAADADPACASLAADKNIVFEWLPAISAGACGAPSPIKLSAIRIEGGGTVTIEPPATMRCATALALADWMRSDVIPAARQSLGTDISTLRNAASYDCRGRNRIKGAKLSEHGKANAFDIGAFRKTSGEWIEVARLGEAKSLFAEIRAKACGRFTTVLGPGSDGYHEEHLHLDLAQRGRNKRALYCK